LKTRNVDVIFECHPWKPATFLEYFVTPLCLLSSYFYSAPVAVLRSYYHSYYTLYRLQFTAKAYTCVFPKELVAE